MKNLVAVDASLAVMWAISEPLTQQALILASRWAAKNTRLIPPCLILAEITNTLHKRILRREMDLDTAQGALRVILDFNIQILEEPGLPARALELAFHLKLPTTYDAHYLALAERYDCDLWTADKRLYHLARRNFPRVKWIGTILA